MGSIGQSLREARENRGISLEDVSKATKIRTEFLVAMEGGDFERLPDNVFSRGFVRVYAELVGLDPDAAVAASAAERKALGTGEEEPPDVLAELNRLIPDKASPAERPPLRRLLVGAAAIVVIGVVILATWLIVGRDTREPIERASVPSIREPAPAPVSVAPPPAVPQLTLPRAVEEPVRTAAAAEVHEPAPIPTLATPSAVVDEPARPLAARSSSLSVPELAVGRGVANRRVVDPSDSFVVGQTVWFWTRVEGAAPGERIRHVWLHAGQQVHTIDLPLGAASWRTQSAKRMRPASRGDWRVEARDAAGRVLAAADFVCR